MDKPSIFFDLDGPILDVSERIYQVYRYILKKHNKKFLQKSRYLRLKRERIPIREILKETDAEDILQDYKKEWNELIEKPYYLEFDQISREKKRALLSLKKEYKLTLITLRNNRRELYNQLKKKKIDKIFNKILVRSGKDLSPKWRIKSELLKKYGKFNKDSIIVGDTETDILTGKHLRIKTIAIDNGMRSRKFLKKYKPDILIKDFSKIKNEF